MSAWRSDKLTELPKFVFLENYVDLSDIMSTCRIILSDNFVVICMTLIGHEHVLRFIFKKMKKWQVKIKIWQDDIKIWQVNIIIWQINSLILTLAERLES